MLYFVWKIWKEAVDFQRQRLKHVVFCISQCLITFGIDYIFSRKQSNLFLWFVWLSEFGMWLSILIEEDHLLQALQMAVLLGRQRLHAHEQGSLPLLVLSRDPRRAAPQRLLDASSSCSK